MRLPQHRGCIVDIKTLLILIGLGFLLWSYSGANAVSQETPPASTRSGPAAASQLTDTTTCYDTALAAVRNQWPALSQLQRAALGAQAIQICEAQP